MGVLVVDISAHGIGIGGKPHVGVFAHELVAVVVPVEIGQVGLEVAILCRGVVVERAIYFSATAARHVDQTKLLGIEIIHNTVHGHHIVVALYCTVGSKVQVTVFVVRHHLCLYDTAVHVHLGLDVLVALPPIGDAAQVDFGIDCCRGLQEIKAVAAGCDMGREIVGRGKRQDFLHRELNECGIDVVALAVGAEAALPHCAASSQPHGYVACNIALGIEVHPTVEDHGRYVELTLLGLVEQSGLDKVGIGHRGIKGHIAAQPCRLKWIAHASAHCHAGIFWNLGRQGLDIDATRGACEAAAQGHWVVLRHHLEHGLESW